MTTDTAPRMTVAEISLMREVVRWRRANGWLYHSFAARWVESRTGRAVSYDPRCSEVGLSADYHHGTYHWYCAQSVTQSIDVLTAFGYLPARFSSAYRAGWFARCEYDDAGRYSERQALLPARTQ